jgi:hypothetical protein
VSPDHFAAKGAHREFLCNLSLSALLKRIFPIQFGRQQLQMPIRCVSQTPILTISSQNEKPVSIFFEKKGKAFCPLESRLQCFLVNDQAPII